MANTITVTGGHQHWSDQLTTDDIWSVDRLNSLKTTSHQIDYGGSPLGLQIIPSHPLGDMDKLCHVAQFTLIFFQPSFNHMPNLSEKIIRAYKNDSIYIKTKRQSQILRESNPRWFWGEVKLYTPVHIIVKERQTFIHGGSKSTSVSTHFHESSIFFWTLTSYSFTYLVFTCPGDIKLVSNTCEPCKFNTNLWWKNHNTDLELSPYHHEFILFMFLHYLIGRFPTYMSISMEGSDSGAIYMNVGVAYW